MRIGRGAATMVVAAALTVGTVAVDEAPAAAAAEPAAATTRWSPALRSGDAVGVTVSDGGVRLAAPPAATDSSDGPPDHSLGLLTLPARTTSVPVDRVEAVVDLATGTDAAQVAVDVRGLRIGGGWTEWLPTATHPSGPAAARPPDPPLSVALPEPVTQVQARLVLIPRDAPATGPTGPNASGPTPVVRALHLTAYPAPPSARTQARKAAVQYRVFATREGLVGGTTANGHVITDRDMFVALPSRRALAPRDSSDYSVKVCASNGRCAFAPVWDVGPWNTHDDYWNPPDRRESWRDLPQGMPQSQAAKTRGYNGGKDQFGRVVRNPAGIDLSDGLFRDALGLTDNAWVTVDYLWTGDSPLAALPVKGHVDLRGAPDPAARIVGIVAGGAAVPVQCVTRGWLRIGVGQFIPAHALPRASSRHLPVCGR
jgi:hypothetical protein